jgi:heme oxygenase
MMAPMGQAVRGVSAGLAQALREGTRQPHIEAERAGVMPLLLQGRLPLPAYCALLQNLHALYTALEQALDTHAAHACIAPVHAASLRRSAALLSDLHTLAPGGDAPALRPATQAYVQHLDTLSRDAPQLLLAHAYVRYLGDLSGGQVLRRIVGKAYHLEGGPGARFYDFGSAEEVKAMVLAFRSGLDAVPADEAFKKAVVAEARSAFERHQVLFVQLLA